MENSVLECLLYYVNLILLSIMNMRRNIRVMHEQELFLMIKKYIQNMLVDSYEKQEGKTAMEKGKKE
jgi:hypothetical protein